MSFVLAVPMLVAAQIAVPLVLPPHSVPGGALRPVTMVRAPQERAKIQSYFSPFDYPAAARGASGTVSFTLTIGPDGRVIGCAITHSSGSAALDNATCQVIRRRARYVPALDSNANATAGTIDQKVEWKMP